MTVKTENISYVQNILDQELQTNRKVVSDTNSSKSILVSCMIGNAIEWYDFVIYGYFAAQLGALFFPKVDPSLQLLASWGVFWTGYLSRPLGSIIFGHIGDKISRKAMLTLSIYFMAIPTTLMGCLPTYSQIGITATLIMVFLRTLQGFAMGGGIYRYYGFSSGTCP